MKSIDVLSLLMISGLTLSGCDKGDLNAKLEAASEADTDSSDEDSADSILLGDWKGACGFPTYDIDIKLDIEEEVEDGDALDFSGDVDASFEYYGYFFDLDGDLTGSLGADSSISMLLDFGDNGWIDIEGALDDPETIDGDCSSGGAEGEIELKRD